jgi:hypothetical protein
MSDGPPAALPTLQAERIRLRPHRKQNLPAFFVLRERWQVAGEVCDSAIYGLLASDWQAHSQLLVNRRSV